MNWFQTLCRNMGLMVHHIAHPQDTQRKVIRRETEVEKHGDVTLRRTTIEEIEIKKGKDM